MALTLKIDKGIFSVDLSSYKKYIEWHLPSLEFFPMDPGENHHKLLAYLSKQLPPGSKVADLGTNTGASAIAFASNPNVRVYTYDVSQRTPENRNQLSFLDLPNIQFIVDDAIHCVETYVDSKIILLDISPHNGYDEKIILDALIANGYKGILICDDIFYSDGMELFWNAVNLKKLDVTGYGHHSGTGIIVFSEEELDVAVS